MTRTLNFIARRGSAVSVKTFTRGVNCTITQYEKDTSSVKNKIQVLGYGSGANQVKSAIKEDAPSQYFYGIREYTKTDRDLRDVATCDLYADTLLADMKDPIERFTVGTLVDAGLDITTGDTVTIIDNKLNINGEYRVVKIERNFGRDGNWLNIEVSNKQSSFVNLFEEQQTSVNNEQELTRGDTIRFNEDFYAEASPSGSWPDTTAVYNRFTTPNSEQINNIKLNLNVTKFRVNIDSGGVGSGGAGNYGLNNIDLPSKDTTSGLPSNYTLTSVPISSQDTSSAGGASTIADSGSSESTTSMVNDTWTKVIDFGTQSSTATSGIWTLTNFFCGGAYACYWRLKCGSNYYPSSSGVYQQTSTNLWKAVLLLAPITVASLDCEVEAKLQTGGGNQNLTVSGVMFTIGLHTHSSSHPDGSNSTGSGSLSHIQAVDPSSYGYTTGSGNISHADHSWTYTAGISEESLPSISYDVYVGPSSANPEDDELQAWQNAAVHYGPYSNKALALALTNTFAVNSRYTIKIKPTADIGFQLNLQTVHFNSSVTL